MIIQQDSNSATYQIQRFEDGKIWINQQCYQTSMIIRPHELLTWRPFNLNEVTNDDFLGLFEKVPQILLLGTGPTLIIPPQSLLNPLFEKGIGVEFMSSRSACATFMVLSGEERNVAACILVK